MAFTTQLNCLSYTVLVAVEVILKTHIKWAQPFTHTQTSRKKERKKKEKKEKSNKRKFGHQF